MSYAAYRRDFGSFGAEAPSKIESIPKRSGLLRRIFDAFTEARQRDVDRQIFDAFTEARQRDVDRQIVRFLAARSAGTLTDDLEREISQRLSTWNWSVNTSPYGERRFS